MDEFLNKQSIIHQLRQRDNIVGLSGGKDSVLTCLLLLEYNIPFRTVTAEVWWKKDITGENPYHYAFLHEKLFPFLRSQNIRCDIIHSKVTAYEYMTTPIRYSKEHPERIGKLRGFPLCGACGIQRDCKARPCEKYYKRIMTPFNVITGIAFDERDRLYSNTANNRISLLEALKINELDTFKICNDAGLLSPIYKFTNRNGCWFCPNQSIQELEVLYREHPELWEELMTIQRMSNKVQEKFNRTQTLYDIEKEIKQRVQMKLYRGQLY